MLATRAHRQHAAVNAIRAAGGTVVYDYENEGSRPPGPAWLRNLIGDDFSCSPIIATLVGVDVTDELIEKHLSGLSHLQALDVDSAKVTDKSLARVAKLTELQKLVLNCPQLTVTGLQQLAPLKSLDAIHSFRNRSSDRACYMLGINPSVNSQETSMDFLFSYLSDKYHVPFRIDSSPRRPPPAPEVLLKINSTTVRGVLEQIIRQCNLDYVVKIKDGAIVLVPTEAAQTGWPAWATLRELFPDAWELETDW